MAIGGALPKCSASRSGSKLLAFTLLVAITLQQVHSVASTSRFHQHLPDHVMYSLIESPPPVAPRFRVSPSQRTPAQRLLSTDYCDKYACHNAGDPGVKNGVIIPPAIPSSPPPPA